jgi:uncharacterized protein YkwD
MLPLHMFSYSRFLRSWHMIPILMLCCLLLPANVSAQQPRDTIIPAAANLQLISRLIKNGVDSLRLAHNLPILLSDSSLLCAAADHAGYLKTSRSISHQQPIAAKATVQKRAEHCGGARFLCGENVAASYVVELMAELNGRQYRNITYQQMADEFVRLWVNSTGHHQNIMNPAYQYTGVAVSLNAKTNRIVAVQVFGVPRPSN